MKKKSMQLLGVLALFAVSAAAQDMPRAEMFLGYTYFRANSATNVPAFSANGGGGDFVVNFSPSWGFVTDLGIVKNGNIGGFNVNSTIFPFMFGPRYTVHNERWIPYFQYLLGGAYEASSLPVDVEIPPHPTNPIFIPGLGEISERTAITARLNASQTAFAMSLGGGLNVRVSKNVTYRMMGLDWLMTRFQNYRSDSDNNQQNLRVTTGVNFTFGAQ